VTYTGDHHHPIYQGPIYIQQQVNIPSSSSYVMDILIVSDFTDDIIIFLKIFILILPESGSSVVYDELHPQPPTIGSITSFAKHDHHYYGLAAEPLLLHQLPSATRWEPIRIWVWTPTTNYSRYTPTTFNGSITTTTTGNLFPPRTILSIWLC